jgi:hypothetical protein
MARGKRAQPHDDSGARSTPPSGIGDAGKGGLKATAVATTLYLLPADHKRLRRLAIDRNVSFQTLALDAFDLLLQSLDEEPVGRWETRRKPKSL